MSHAGEAMSEMTLEQVIPFLLGEEEMEEVYFGERPLNMGRYWWREHLRDAWKAHLAASKAQTVDVAKLDKPARVDGATFGTGVPWSTVIGAAQRAYDVKPLTPEQIAKLRQMFPPKLNAALPKE